MTESATPARLIRQALRPFVRRVMWAAAYFAAIFVVGAIGCTLIEGWGWFESIYMAVTTVTSVGFMEIQPLSPAGRLFTMCLIALGLMGLGIWWALTTALIVELDLIGLFRRRKMMSEISHLSDHFIVCGLGRMGRVVVEEMISSEIPFVVIEKDPVRITPSRPT